MLFWGAGFGGPDPASTWLKTCVSQKGTWAVHGVNDEVEALAEKQAVEFDQARRTKIIDQIVQILWRDAWFIPLWEPVYIQAVRTEWKYQSMPAWASFNIFSLSRK
jgi:ABC-type transport system substrate-binding protein